LWDLTISFDDFIGNDSEISKMVSWLGEFFHEKSEKTKGYAIITGDSGNGKTALVYALANGYNVSVVHVSPEDIREKDELIRLKQGINVRALGSETRHKIILIDDITDYYKDIQKQLISNIVKLSNHPILFTTTELYKLPSWFTENGEVCRLKKPTHDELKGLLSKVAKKYGISVTASDLQDIVSKAPSVRTALNSLFSPNVSEIINPELSIFKKIKLVRDNKLDRPLDNYTLKILDYNCHEIKDVLYLTSLVITSELNHHSDTNPFLLNNVEFRLPGRFDFFSTKKPKYLLSPVEQRLVKMLHISAKTFKTEYKFLSVEEEDKEKSVKKAEKKEDKSVKSLSNFF